MPHWGDYNAFDEWGAHLDDEDGLRSPAWRGDVMCAVLGNYVDRRRERILDKQFWWDDTPPVAAVLAAVRGTLLDLAATVDGGDAPLLAIADALGRAEQWERDIIRDRGGDYMISWPAVRVQGGHRARIARIWCPLL